MFKKNDQKNEYCFPNYETEQIKEAFDIFDINRNGYIGVDELKEIFTIINEEVSEEELNEMIGLADKEGDGQVNWLNFYEFINGNGINEDIKRMKRIDDEEEIEYEDGDDYKKNNKKFKLIGENNFDSQKNSNLNESINDSNMNSNNISNVDSNFSKKKNIDDLSYKKIKVSHFKYKEDNSFNESNNKSNDSENEYNKINNNDNNNYNEINDNLFDEVNDDGKKK